MQLLPKDEMDSQRVLKNFANHLFMCKLCISIKIVQSCLHMTFTYVFAAIMDMLNHRREILKRVGQSCWLILLGLILNANADY